MKLNAFKILENPIDKKEKKFSNDKNSSISFEPAAGVSELATASRKIGILEENIRASYFDIDPVIYAVTDNPNTATLFEFLKALFSTTLTSYSAHSSGGTGALKSEQVETPVQGGPQRTPEGNARLLEFVNGKLEERATIEE